MYDDGPLSTRQQLDALKLERERAKLLADQAKAQQQVNKVALDARQSFAKQDPRRVDVPPVQPEVPTPTRSLTNAERAARESSNNPEAINLKSTAGGLYQMTEAARADARKANPALRDLDYYPLKDSNGNVDPAQMQRSIEAQNSYKDAYEGVIQKQLTSLGVPAEIIDQNAINQAWVVGPTGYKNILNAEPGTPLENILSKEAIAKNPNLQNKTAGSFLSDPDPYSRVNTREGDQASTSIRLDNADNDPRRTDIVPPVNNLIMDPRDAVATKQPTGREVLIAKQDLAHSTDRDTRARAQAVLDRANNFGIQEPGPMPQVPPKSTVNEPVPVPPGILDPELGNEFGGLLEGETRTKLIKPAEVVKPPLPPVKEAPYDENFPAYKVTDKDFSELPDLDKERFNKLGSRGSTADPADLQAEVARYAEQRDLKGKSGAAPKMPEKKEDLSPTFWEKLSESFGDLFTDKEFIKFGILLAGGLLTGGSFGGSLKYAGLYALQSADKREAAQASENKELKKKLIDQGYSIEAIDKYFGSGRTEDLGEPKTTLTYKTTGEQMTIDRGPDSGKVFQVREATYATGKRKGDVDKVVMVNGKPIPLDTFQRTYQSKGLNVVPYSSSEHSPAAVSKRFDALLSKSGDIAEEALTNKLGASNVKGKANPERIGIPGGKVIANQAASYFKAIGFNPDNSDDSREINTLMESAVNDMIADKQNRNLKEVRSIEPYLANNIIKFRTGLNPDMLRISETKMVPPEKIVALHNLGKQVSFELNNGKISEPQVQGLLQQIATKYNTDPEIGKRYKASKDETKFYQYAKDFLSDILKQSETK